MNELEKERDDKPRKKGKKGYYKLADSVTVKTIQKVILSTNEILSFNLKFTMFITLLYLHPIATNYGTRPFNVG